MPRRIHWTCRSSKRWEGHDGSAQGPILVEAHKYAAGWKVRRPRGLWALGPFKTFHEMADAAELFIR
jgi:hypothetical protein